MTGVNFFTPFFGTSASAPHAAAVAVLLKDVDPGLGPAGIARILRETSLERGDPGFDTTWGFGLIDAFAAAKRAGQVGNSHLFWVCLPTKKGIQLVVPEFLIPARSRSASTSGAATDEGRLRALTLAAASTGRGRHRSISVATSAPQTVTARMAPPCDTSTCSGDDTQQKSRAPASAITPVPRP